MTRSRFVTATALGLVVLIAASAAFLTYRAMTESRTIFAYFSSATSIYPGDEVRVLGVKVGRVAAITPDGTEAEMTLEVDHNVQIPVDAKAVIISPNLVSARYVQLTPAYSGTGPTMGDGGVIPLSRTAVPVEWDEVKSQLMRLATDLGPQTSASSTALARLIDSAANAMGGNGVKLRETLRQLSGAARIFAEGSGNIVDIIKYLQTFVSALRDSKEQIVLFENRFASLTTVLSDSSSDLDAALKDLSTVIVDVQRFVAGSRHQAAEQVRSLTSVTQNLVDNRKSLENVLHLTPTSIANYHNIYYPNAGGVSGAFSLNNFSNPIWFICGMIGALENTTAPETAKRCAQYLGPALKSLNFNNVPLPINAYLRPSVNPEKIIYTDPKLAPGGAGPGDLPEPPPVVSAYTGRGDVPAPPGWQQPAPPPGLYGSGEVPAIPSPALFPNAPIPAPPTILPGPASIDNMLMPPTAPPDAPRDQPVLPSGPLLPAERASQP
ncbi:Uncharacterised protein [Mycolicibacterium vanbaalenii]|uniref:Uncharacterized protein n=1 Tax=Mycolicibacterium vanbaalenii TaxID=110539 RepID=A0A5S9QYC9_MYCVN|nr:MCE family protein [Mycolicibacterium vanbaalenii]CAA0124475.1 Uncharacterised protein [Mycolicibacterium vanbaalenii]